MAQQFMSGPAPQQDEFNTLSQTVSNLGDHIATLESKITHITDLGMLTAMPTLNNVQNGIVGFGLSSQTNVGTSGTLPAGTRFIGYCNSAIGHFLAMPNNTSIFIVRGVGNEWEILSNK